MTSTSLILFWSTFLGVVSPIFGYNVLVYCVMPSRSHYNLCRGVVDTLVDRGHDVSFISPFKAEKTKFKDYGIPKLAEFLDGQLGPSFDMERSALEMIKMLSSAQVNLAEAVFSDERVKALMSDKSQKFDAVIFEYFMNEMAVGLGVKYDCPVIALSSLSPMQWLAGFTNNPISVATVPNVFTSFTGNMNLQERVTNFVFTTLLELLGKFYMQPTQQSLYEKYLPEESAKVPYKELVTRISGVISNSHPSVGIARPLLPHTVEIGGYHIKDPEPLPQDLKKILDEAKNGVIYFSMGSVLKTSDMSSELKSLLLKVLGKLKQTVLWKYEENLPNVPKNVIIRKWMPQTGILAHPNIKLFITHGGLLSRTEAAHFGVPLLAIPIFGDQPHNAKSIQERGNGVHLAFSNVTEQSFEWALNEVLGNPKYAEVTKEIYRLYHDRPMKPSDLLNYHVEHIIRSKGAKHLAPAHLSRCSHLLLDVYAVILIPLFAVFALLSCVTWKCCCSRKKQSEQSGKKVKRQ